MKEQGAERSGPGHWVDRGRAATDRSPRQFSRRLPWPSRRAGARFPASVSALKHLAAVFLLAFTLSGCASRMVMGGLRERDIVVTGRCTDGQGSPRSGVTATAKEVRGDWPMLFGPLAGPRLPELRLLATASSDATGTFVLRFRSSRELRLELKNASGPSALEGQTRLAIPEEGTDLALSVLVEDGRLTARWSTPPNQPAQPEH